MGFINVFCHSRRYEAISWYNPTFLFVKFPKVIHSLPVYDSILGWESKDGQRKLLLSENPGLVFVFRHIEGSYQALWQYTGWEGGVCWPGEQMVGWGEGLLAGRQSQDTLCCFFFFNSSDHHLHKLNTHTHRRSTWMSKAKSVNRKGHSEARLHVFLKYHCTFCKGNIS